MQKLQFASFVEEQEHAWPGLSMQAAYLGIVEQVPHDPMMWGAARGSLRSMLRIAEERGVQE